MREIKRKGFVSWPDGALEACGHAQWVQLQNAQFAVCVMYVLGVDMLSQWHKDDPVYAPRGCVPRTITAGDLILAVQEHIEATAPRRADRGFFVPCRAEPDVIGKGGKKDLFACIRCTLQK
jgi:hypothetical protein